VVESARISKEFVGQLLQAEPRIYAYIRAQIPDRADAEDVLQDTVLALWTSYAAFKPGSSFVAWAYGFAKNKVLHHRRRNARQHFVFSEEAVRQIAAEAESMSDELAGLQDALRGCLAKLRTADREVVERCYESGRTVAAVAAELGRSINTIKAVLKRSRRALYDCIRRTLAQEEHR
jgi:RNA polymerase sigma-70 factor (ECF subfamily)